MPDNIQKKLAAVMFTSLVEYDEYLKNLTPGENDKGEDRLNNRTKKLRLKDES